MAFTCWGCSYMKKRYILLLLLLFTISVRCVAEDTSSGILETLKKSGITNPVQLRICGNTAACFTEKSGKKSLCVLEKINGTWQLDINNPNALKQDRDFPILFMDNDDTLFWKYESEVINYDFSCYKQFGASWGNINLTMSASFGRETVVYLIDWIADNGGEIVYQKRIYDKNENPITAKAKQYLPAAWLKNYITLENFDVSRFPVLDFMIDRQYIWSGQRFFKDAAHYLMPQYRYLNAILRNNEMHFLMQKPNGEKVYVICEYGSNLHKIDLIESSPLPKDALLGMENLTDCLALSQDRLVYLQNFPHSPFCGLSRSENAYGDFLYFGRDCVFTDKHKIYVGYHPWNNISIMDWSSIPISLSEATNQMDAGRLNLCYAAVNNPNPADRLHLRQSADRNSRSLGKYYNGSPVKVYEILGDWAHVEIGQQSGYMIKKYLMMGKAGKALLCDTSATPQLTMRENVLKLYEWPDGLLYDTRDSSSGMIIIGIIGKDWYHAWFPLTDEFVFIRQSDVWEGNG